MSKKVTTNLNSEKEKEFKEDIIEVSIEEIEDKFNLSVGIIVGYSVLTLTILTLLTSIRGKLSTNNHLLYPIIHTIVNFITNPYIIFFICLGEFMYAGFAAYKGVKGKIQKRKLRYRKLSLNADKYTKEDREVLELAIKNDPLNGCDN